MSTNLILPGLADLVKPFRFAATPHEYKVVALRECLTPQELMLCDTPEKVAKYWRLHVEKADYFNPECECFCVLILNTRRRVKGHYLVSIGTMDTLLVHAREVFRLAIFTSAIVLAHNHPSGDPTPSEADIKARREVAQVTVNYERNDIASTCGSVRSSLATPARLATVGSEAVATTYLGQLARRQLRRSLCGCQRQRSRRARLDDTLNASELPQASLQPNEPKALTGSGQNGMQWVARLFDSEHTDSHHCRCTGRS